MSVKDIPEILSNITNAPRNLELNKEIDRLRKENNDIKLELQSTQAKLNEYDKWDKVSETYEKFETESGAVVFVMKSDKKTYYCPVCFNKKSTNPLQPVPENIVMQENVEESTHKYCPACNRVYRIKNSRQTRPSFSHPRNSRMV